MKPSPLILLACWLALVALGCSDGDATGPEASNTSQTGGPSPTPQPSPQSASTLTGGLTANATAPPSPAPTIEPFMVSEGDRILITKIGVDAPLALQVVGADGRLESTGPTAVDIYDLSALEGYGGWPGVGGNTVVGGWPQPGPGSFTGLTDLQGGDEVLLRLQGEEFGYYVVVVCRATVADFDTLLKATEDNVLTLIQAAGFDADRVYVLAEAHLGETETGCPAGGPA